ncbi:low molecular weight phosphotyrosine protein phosphatase-like [Paramacrobiotus metropolitanus]|uniref:low molecular weight phosphotyrosine protein phosphatase-like n=1 Tax=Paramacrobiotus metropolitanus TaxID=2943436 RepID=UPI002445B0A8|nr:low molecular weight phosphotyrosine protein phosphatase-like [Paramacrobiotus metropolitanus]
MGKNARTDPGASSPYSFLRRGFPCLFPKTDEMASNPRSVLFVCLGNICRSPIAEAVFRQVAKERGILDDWVIDSAATADYHVGEPPDNRAEACLRRHGLSSTHIVRQLTPEDFQNFAYIMGMDHTNLKNIKRYAPKNLLSRLDLLGQYDPQHELIIEDPYYGGDAEFDIVYEQCLRSCRGFLDNVEKELQKSTSKRH